MNVQALTLHTRDLAALHDFSAQKLGFPVGRPAIPAAFEVTFQSGSERHTIKGQPL